MTTDPHRKFAEDLARERRELSVLANIAGGAAAVLAVMWASGTTEGRLVAMAAVLTGMASLCAWICADVCRKALSLLDSRETTSSGHSLPGSARDPDAQPTPQEPAQG